MGQPAPATAFLALCAPQDPARRVRSLPHAHVPPVTARLPLCPGSNSALQLDIEPSSLTERTLQNPPAIPTLAIVKLVAFLRGSRVIIDWHNTGYSVLALRLGHDHLAVSLARSCAPLLLLPSSALLLTPVCCAALSTSLAGQPLRTFASRTRCGRSSRARSNYGKFRKNCSTEASGD